MSWKTFCTVVAFVAVWLFFESAMSWLATCQPPYERAAQYRGEQNHCTFFIGPVAIVSYWAVVRLSHFLRQYEHELVSGFTIILGISTIGLWLSTRALWKAGDAELTHLKEASERQSSDMQASIQAAKDANLLTRDIFIAGHRPWLQWALPPRCILTRNGPHLTCTIDATLNNLGNAPAFNIYYFGWLYLNQPSGGGILNIGRMYFDQNLNQARSFGISGLAATILPKEIVPARFSPRGLETDSLPEDFTLYLAFHARYTFAVSGSQWPQAEAEIGTVYCVQPFGKATAAFNKAEVMRKDEVISALIELPMGRRIT